jgi:TolB-like protein
MRRHVGRCSMVLTLLSLLPLTLYCQQRPGAQRLHLAVLDFEAREGVPKGDAATLSDLFSSELQNTGEFTVVDRSRIKAILDEQGFQQSEACSQVECVVDVGRILKVEKMFSGVVGKVGKIYTVTIRLVDISTAQIQVSRSYQHEGDIEGLARDVIPEMVKDISRELTGKNVQVARVGTSGGSTWYYYVGGAVLVGGVATYFLLKPKSSGTAAHATLPDPPALP